MKINNFYITQKLQLSKKIKHKGTAMIYTLAVITILLVLSIGLLGAGTENRLLADKLQKSQKLKLMAESGIEQALVALKQRVNDDPSIILNPDNLILTDLSGNVTAPNLHTISDPNGVTVNISFRKNVPRKGITNCVQITSTAQNGGESKTITAYIDPNDIRNKYLDLLFDNTLITLDKPDKSSTATSLSLSTDSNFSSDKNHTQMTVYGNCFFQGNNIDFSLENLKLNGMLRVNAVNFNMQLLSKSTAVFGDSWISTGSSLDSPIRVSNTTNVSDITKDYTLNPIGTSSLTVNVTNLAGARYAPTIKNENISNINLDIKGVDSSPGFSSNVDGTGNTDIKVKDIYGTTDYNLVAFRREANLKDANVIFFQVNAAGATIDFNDLVDKATKYVVEKVIHGDDTTYTYNPNNPTIIDQEGLASKYIVYLVNTGDLGGVDIKKNSEIASSINNILYCNGKIKVEGSLLRTNSTLCGNKIIVDQSDAVDPNDPAKPDYANDWINLDLHGIPRKSEPEITYETMGFDPNNGYQFVDDIERDDAGNPKEDSLGNVIGKTKLVSPRRYEKVIQEFLINNIVGFGDGVSFNIVDWVES
ncbi:MAG: hypothetical protein Q8936_00975 [Bacillota bacterium]|nr:hypothetical protein [Bacillota bacterium]